MFQSATKRGGMGNVSGCSSAWREVVVFTAMLAVTLSLTGCDATQKKKAREAQEAAAVEQAVLEHAARLEALRLEEERRQQMPVPEVTWLDAGSLLRDEPKAVKSQATAEPAVPDQSAVREETTAIVKTAANAAVEPVPAVAEVPTPVLGSASRDDLLGQLLFNVRREQGDAMTRAMDISYLLGLAGRSEFDAYDLETLSQSQKARARQFHELAMLLREQAISPGGATHYQAILDHLDALMADVPLHIRKVELSRSVSSYGVMEPLEARTFLAGRNQPMIVYVELEHFKALREGGDTGKFTVKLAQELVLYNEADGLAVWREPRVQIVDESLNRRRDFFVVQRIELPARLSVGKYLLKITMTDLQGGSIDETSIPLQIVADPSLVKKD